MIQWSCRSRSHNSLDYLVVFLLKLTCIRLYLPTAFFIDPFIYLSSSSFVYNLTWNMISHLTGICYPMPLISKFSPFQMGVALFVFLNHHKNWNIINADKPLNAALLTSMMCVSLLGAFNKQLVWIHFPQHLSGSSDSWYSNPWNQSFID